LKSLISIIIVHKIRSIYQVDGMFFQLLKKPAAGMTGGVLYYYVMYVCAVARILSCSAAGLQGGQHFVSSLLERFKEGSKPPSHYTPGKTTRDCDIIVLLYRGHIFRPLPGCTQATEQIKYLTVVYNTVYKPN